MIAKNHKRVIPSSRCLLEIVNYLLQPIDMRWKIMLNKARRLVHINLFGKGAMEKGIVNVH